MRGERQMSRLIPYKNGKSIAAIKLHHIDNIALQAAKCANIERIMLFGSSLEDRCTEKSDIDIAVFGNQSKSKYLLSREFKRFHDGVFLFDLNQDYDILYFSTREVPKDSILQDINKGIEIYRRVLA